jgi:hypothetical protein
MTNCTETLKRIEKKVEAGMPAEAEIHIKNKYVLSEIVII